MLARRDLPAMPQARRVEMPRMPHCERIRKFPYCCVGCPKSHGCRLPKLRFVASQVVAKVEYEQALDKLEYPRQVVEMDTVVGPVHALGCLLTLLFRSCDFLLAMPTKSKTAEEVSKAFARTRETLGPRLFSETFGLILTDRGTEFWDPLSIEIDPDTGEKPASVFYCDPNRPDRKGKPGKCHVELRKVFPKGTDFSKIAQAQVNLGLRHVNSEPRSL